MTSVPCAPAPASPALLIHSETTISTLGGSKNPYPAQDLPSTVKGKRQVVLGVCACYACASVCACMPTCYAGRWAHRGGLGLRASTKCNTYGRQLIFHGLGGDPSTVPSVQAGQIIIRNRQLFFFAWPFGCLQQRAGETQVRANLLISALSIKLQSDYTCFCHSQGDWGTWVPAQEEKQGTAWRFLDRL